VTVIKPLSPQHQNGARTDGRVPSPSIDGFHYDSISSRLHLEGQFLGSTALLKVDRTFFHSSHLFNGIEVRTIGRPMILAPDTVTVKQTALSTFSYPLKDEVRFHHPGKAILAFREVNSFRQSLPNGTTAA
jgi:hypothetical protein